MTVRELINKLLDEPMDREVMLSCKEDFIDERGEKCRGYVFDIGAVKKMVRLYLRIGEIKQKERGKG